MTRQQPTSPDLSAALMRVLRQPAFVVIALVLLVCAVALNASVQFLKLHFKKEAIELARPLGGISDRLGSWVQVTQDEPLNSEIEDVLGTDTYIFRSYVDERLAGTGVQQRFRNARELIDKKVQQITEETDPKKRAQLEKERKQLQSDYDKMLPAIRAAHPMGVVNLSVTYYTGMVDTVAHVPDRCVTADGYEPKSYDTVSWPIARGLPVAKKPLKSDGSRSDEIAVRYINFEDQTGTSNVTRSITYFFHANGEFDSDPLGVRQKLARLWEKKAYYAKIEVMTTIEDPHESARVMTDFLAAAMPEIDRCLPDWDKAHGRESGVEAVAAK